MYETTKGEKVDPKPESCPKRAEGSSAKAGTVNHCGQKAARPKQERSTSAQKAARPKPKSCPKRAEGSSPKAGTVDQRAKGSSPKAGKLPQAGRMQLAQCRNVDQSAQKAARPKSESCPKRAKAALANKDWDFLQSSSPKSGKHPAQ
jgi:hypothetical protein